MSPYEVCKCNYAVYAICRIGTVNNIKNDGNASSQSPKKVQMHTFELTFYDAKDTISLSRVRMHWFDSCAHTSRSFFCTMHLLEEGR